MQAEQIVQQLDEGTVLEGPFFGEPVRVLLAKAHGDRVEIVAEGINTKQTRKKLLKAEDSESAVTIKSTSGMVTLSGDARKFHLVAEAHRIRLACQYDPYFAVRVSQIDPLLLELLDPDRCMTGGIHTTATDPVENRITCRRLKKGVRRFDGGPSVGRRKVLPDDIDLPGTRWWR